MAGSQRNISNSVVTPARELAGLSAEEAEEFAAIDALPPFDAAGNIAWVFQGSPTTARENRWLTLYKKATGRTGADLPAGIYTTNERQRTH